MTSSPDTLGGPPLLLEQFLTGYWSARTRANYAFIIGGWFTWCSSHEHDPLRDADPRVVERWVSPSSIAAAHQSPPRRSAADSQSVN